MNVYQPNESLSAKINGLEIKLLNGDAKGVHEEIVFLLEQLHYKEEQPFDETSAAFCKLLAIASKDLADFAGAIRITKKLIYYYNGQQQMEDLADCYLNLAIIYRHLSRFNEALEKLEAATELFKTRGLTSRLAKCELNLGLIYFLLKYFEEAFKRTEKAKKLFEQMIPHEQEGAVSRAYCDLGLASCYHALGIICLDNHQPDQAIEYLENSRQIAEKIHKKRLLGYIYQDLGQYYLTDGAFDTDKALGYIQESIDIRKELKDKKGLATCTLLLGEFHGKLSKWKEALDYFINGQQQASNIDALDLRIRAFNGIFESNYRLGRHPEAVLAIKEYENLKAKAEEKRKENRLQLEKMYPLNAEIELLQKKYSRAESVLAQVAHAISLIVNGDHRGIRQYSLPQSSQEGFQAACGKLDKEEDWLTGLQEWSGLIIKSKQESVGKEEEIIHPEYRNKLEFMFRQLLENHFIASISYADFETQFTGVLSGKSKPAITWKKDLHDLAYLFYYMNSKNILTGYFSSRYIRCIEQRFLNKEGGPINTGTLTNVFNSKGLSLNSSKNHRKTDPLEPEHALMIRSMVDEWAGCLAEAEM